MDFRDPEDWKALGFVFLFLLVLGSTSLFID
jgi:hypothetical protein